MKVAIFAGTGVKTALDVKIALERMAVKHREINEEDIQDNRLLGHDILVVPGGYTWLYMPSLGDLGRERIRSFIAEGGKFIGICSGAYIAPKSVILPSEFNEVQIGLDIIDIEVRRTKGRGIRRIKVVKSEHPLVSGYHGFIDIYYQNGPLMKAGRDVEVLAVYETGEGAILFSGFGNGKVILFGPHPEGSLHHNVNPIKIGTLNLLKNAIFF
ncbi:MAG: BPL-N domain-containing protein [Candidatus Hodarchaeota archaeon]